MNNRAERQKRQEIITLPLLRIRCQVALHSEAPMSEMIWYCGMRMHTDIHEYDRRQPLPPLILTAVVVGSIGTPRSRPRGQGQGCKGNEVLTSNRRLHSFTTSNTTMTMIMTRSHSNAPTIYLCLLVCHLEFWTPHGTRMQATRRRLVVQQWVRHATLSLVCLDF